MKHATIESHQALLQQYQAQYNSALEAGEIDPFIYPYETLAAGILILYLLIPNSERRFRYTIFALIAGLSTSTIVRCRSLTMGNGFGIGLICCWCILWSATVLIFNDSQGKFKRIERKVDDGSGEEADGKVAARKEGHLDTSGVNGSRDGLDLASQSRALLGSREVMKTKPRINDGINGGFIPNPPFNNKAQGTPTDRTGTFAWQRYPLQPFSERLDWVLDLITNFRGMGWSWRISGIPPPPPHVQAQLSASENSNSNESTSDADSRVSSTGITRYHTRSSLLRQKIQTLTLGYLSLDVLKKLTMHDPYFWGLPMPVHSLPAPTYLPLTITTSPTLLKSYRLLLSLGGIYTALLSIFTLGPLVFAGLLGPRILGVRGEPWMYPDTYGSFSAIYDKGLAGWWGGWWHQTFRFAFEAPSKRAVEALGWDPTTLKAKALQIFVAFALSGTLHACGSYTTFSNTTHPLTGSFTFFILQPIGIIAQMLASRLLKMYGIAPHIPNRVRQVGNFVVVHVWLYYTAPLLVDDFARGGIWLFEPVPFSVVRGLGFGVLGKEGGEGWCCWRWEWFAKWYWGRRWWRSGLAW
ncbi:MAG: hypothetical protein M1827_000482 [Pycnora praestabilis]|nr:MAG: hypothetical protein M1827_000482 [Pycnora praestabilis]